MTDKDYDKEFAALLEEEQRMEDLTKTLNESGIIDQLKKAHSDGTFGGMASLTSSFMADVFLCAQYSCAIGALILLETEVREYQEKGRSSTIKNDDDLDSAKESLSTLSKQMDSYPVKPHHIVELGRQVSSYIKDFDVLGEDMMDIISARAKHVIIAGSPEEVDFDYGGGLKINEDGKRVVSGN